MDSNDRSNCSDSGGDDEFNFASVENPEIVSSSDASAVEEERENGDGDSGGECNNKDKTPMLDLKKSKVSKIPIRQNRNKSSTMTTGNNQEDDRNECSGGKKVDVNSGREIDVKGKEETDCLGLDGIGESCTATKVAEADDGIGSTRSRRLELFDDIRDIVNDLAARVAASSDEDASQMSDDEFASLSPRAPLAGGEDPEVPIIILEAPEEFRCDHQREDDRVVLVPEDRDSDGVVGGTSQRDHDYNKAETGDTTRCTAHGDGDHHGNGAPPSSSSVDLVEMAAGDGDAGESGAWLCADRSHHHHQDHGSRPTTSGPSIEIGVAQCAQASGCSRVSTAEVCVALHPNHSSCAQPQSDNRHQEPAEDGAPPPGENPLLPQPPIKIPGKSDFPRPSSWCFKNGRLVFDESERTTIRNEQVVAHSKNNPPPSTAAAAEEQSELSSLESESLVTLLTSKELNKRIDDGKSRLKYLEQKLKEAGITDNDEPSATKTNNNQNQIEQVVDNNQNLVEKLQEIGDNYNCNPKEIGPNFCEFDVRQVGTFSGFSRNYNIQVYDELGESSSSSEPSSLSQIDDGDEVEDIVVVNLDTNLSENGTTAIDSTIIMGIDGERTNSKQHNPDRDNLKSLLKRPGKNKDKRTNRVVFNENKNEFFDADYIILIREECDYDDDDDDGVCTCNQHEMVRLTCCEPNCNCSVYDGYDQTPQSPKFAPPLEFVDAVTLSPPEGYKDMELGEQQLLALQQMARSRGQQRTAVCRECSVAQDDDEDEYGDGSQSDNETGGEQNSDHEELEQEEKEKTDQSQQTTPTTPPNDSDTNSPNSQRYILETITMTTVTEQRILREAEDENKRGGGVPPGGSPINGILKGGRLWKQQSLDANNAANTKAPPEPQQVTDSPSVTSDEEGSNRRSVRFIESEQDRRDGCGDGASDNPPEEDEKPEKGDAAQPTMKHHQHQPPSVENNVSPESTEMMLTFKLGNHVLISNNSLKPNSAVRQLFPCTKPPLMVNGKESDESIHQYLVTAESLRAFEEAKRSKLPQIIQSGETDESIKRAIERNTLRRSLIRYEPRAKKNVQKTDNSLVERIKLLTCDVDDNTINAENSEGVIPPRGSPPGEEARNSPEVLHPTSQNINNKTSDKSFSPSSSSTTSSNSSSMSSTYKKITDLFGKRERGEQNNPHQPNDQKVTPSLLPDLGNGGTHLHEMADGGNHCPLAKANSTNESRKQFLSTLAPLTACVSGVGTADEYYYHMNNHVGERASMASSVGTEYSLEDIDEGLKNGEEESKRIAPDVLAGTPSASESGDELAMFVQQDAGRIERIKKKYQPEHHHQQSSKEEDDEHDDYGFNRRPSVRGIKPKFGSTTEILQQIQNQLQPPPPTARVAWPYYSESGLTSGVDNKSRNINQNMPNYQYPNVPEELKTVRNVVPSAQYRPTSLQDDNMYQNCTNQRCVREVYRTNVNQTYSTVMKVGAAGEYYQTLPTGSGGGGRGRGRPLSPPPLEMSKTYHQTMVYIPRNHIEGYQPQQQQQQYYQTASDYVTRVSNQNQINKRYVEPIYQQRILHVEASDHHHHYPPNMLPPPKAMVRVPYQPQQPPPHLIASSRSESPLPGQFSTARATQTPAATASTCNYYPGNPRYRPVVGPIWQGEGNYVTKVNRHSFPGGGMRYPLPADNVSLTDSDSQHSSGPLVMPNGFVTSIPNSPTKPTRFIERGVPEGAASTAPQDSLLAQSSATNSTMTSPTSPQNPPTAGNSVGNNPKPLFYAMNV